MNTQSHSSTIQTEPHPLDEPVPWKDPLVMQEATRRRVLREQAAADAQKQDYRRLAIALGWLLTPRGTGETGMLAAATKRPAGELGIHHHSARSSFVWVIRHMISVGIVRRSLVLFDDRKIILPSRLEAALNRFFSAVYEAAVTLLDDIHEVEASADRIPVAVDHDDRLDELLE